MRPLLALFVVTNPTGWNLGLLIVFFSGIQLRVTTEERVLSMAAEYRDYQEKIQARFFPCRWFSH